MRLCKSFLKNGSNGILKNYKFLFKKSTFVTSNLWETFVQIVFNYGGGYQVRHLKCRG